MPPLTTLTVLQGEDYHESWTITHPVTGAVIDLTAVGFSAVVQIRDVVDATDTLYESTSTAGHLTLTAQGKVQWHIPADVSSAWPWVYARFGIELTYPDDQILRVDQGRIYVSRELVRED